MPVETYAESSFLVSLYRQDDNQEAARAYMMSHRPVLCFSPFSRIELRNALRNAESFGQMTAEDQREAFRQIEEDVREGLLVHTAVSWTDALRRADDLSEEHAATDGQRTIDLLHVAIALECGAKTFLSFDRRQRRLAKAAGLKVKP